MFNIRKLSIYLSIFIGFLFCFLFSENINILAYKSSTIDNVFGSYPVQMDIENYDRINLYSKANYNLRFRSNTLFNVVNNDNDFIYTITSNTSNVATKYSIISNNINYLFEENKTYTISIEYVGNKNNLSNFGFAYDNYNVARYSAFNQTSLTFTYSGNLANYENLYIIVTMNNQAPLNSTFSFKNIMIYEGEYQENLSFTEAFEFGYIYSFCTNASSFSSSVELTISNNDFSYNNSFNVSNSSCLSDNVVHIPFNIDNNGYISLDSITINATFSNTSGTLNSGYYIRLTPILRASYKGQYTTNLYSINRYTYNNLIVNGVNIESNNDSIGYITTNNAITFNYGISDLKSPINVIYYNNVSEVFQNNVIPIYQYISTGFIIGLNSSNISTLNSSNLIFSFSGISTYISGQLATNSPIPENEDTNGKYNSCSAWYDIPCQLGNAITYIIYEAPIISPIIEFFDNFIDLVSDLVVYIKWFEGLGLIFSVFILILFIRMIILLVKGGNDD